MQMKRRLAKKRYINPEKVFLHGCKEENIDKLQCKNIPTRYGQILKFYTERIEEQCVKTNKQKNIFKRLLTWATRSSK